MPGLQVEKESNLFAMFIKNFLVMFLPSNKSLGNKRNQKQHYKNNAEAITVKKSIFFHRVLA